MPRLGSWIEPHPTGIYVRPADAWVDPSQPQERALVTHGHADHARGGHGTVWATPETLAIMGVRYGEQNGCEVAYGQSVTVGEVEVSFVPAGHVLGQRPNHSRLEGRAGGGVGRLQAPTRPDLRAVPAGQMRHLHHRGDLRAAGVPPSRDGRRDRPAADAPGRQSRSLRAGRRLCAGQGATGDRRGAAARAHANQSTFTARWSGCAVSMSSRGSTWASCGWSPAPTRRR